MRTHTYHGNDVWEIRDRIGNAVAHMVNGPPDGVHAVLNRMALLWPTARVVSSVQQAQALEVIVHRNATDCGGTSLALS